MPAEASHSSLFALSSRNERNFRSFVFNHLPTLFTLCKKSNAPSRFFSITSTLFARVPGGRPPSPPKYLHQSASASDASLPERSAPSDQASELELAAARCSLCLYFVISLLRPFTRRNLIRRLIILWRRDTEPILVAWVYTPVSGFVFDALA